MIRKIALGVIGLIALIVVISAVASQGSTSTPATAPTPVTPPVTAPSSPAAAPSLSGPERKACDYLAALKADMASGDYSSAQTAAMNGADAAGITNRIGGDFWQADIDLGEVGLDGSNGNIATASADKRVLESDCPGY